MAGKNGDLPGPFFVELLIHHLKGSDFVILFVIFGLVFSLFLKRNPLTIPSNIQLKAPYLMIGCFAVQILLAILAKNGTDKKFPVILVLTFAGMIVALFLNRHLRGVRYILTGVIFNFIAIVLHDGFMPVSQNAMELAGLENTDMATDSRHQLMGATPFWWLGDWIPFYSPVGSNYVLSPGDLFVGIGLIVFMASHSSRREDRS